MLQALVEQTCVIGHTLRQVPQFDGSFVVLTQATPHLVVPPTHCKPHWLAEHT